MSYSPVGDTLAIIKITWQVYNKIYVVHRDANKEHSKLLADLRVFSDQVKTIRDRFEGSEDAPVESLRAVLKSCSQTLVQFKQKLAKYSDLGQSEWENRLRRIQWVKEQATINEFRQKLENHRRDIQFALTVTGLTTDPERSQQVIEDDTDSEIGDLQALDLCQACLSSQVRRVNTTESSTGLRSARGSLVPTPTIPCTCFYQTRSGNSRRRTYEHSRRPSKTSTSSTNCCSCNESIYHIHSFNPASGETLLGSESDFTPDTPRRTSIKPLQPDPDRLKHDATPSIQDLFRQDYSLKRDGISRDMWLCLATWWMIKSRAILKMSEAGEQSEQADEHEWTTTTSTQQCYADLLKSSWILEEIVLTEDIDLFNTRQRRTISHLARALDEDLNRYHENMQIFRDQGSMESLTPRPKFKLAESCEQSIEEHAMNDPFSAHRWIDVDQDDRGAKHEKVMFQTFVNAQLGDRDQRDKSHDAPYTLLLWTMRGETSLFVSLCDQSGTVNLARSMVAEDLKDYERGKVEATLVLPLDFPNQEAEIRFENASDMHAFFKTPKLIFDKTSDKQPRPRELAVFQNPIKSCTDRSLPTPYRGQQDRVLKSGKYSSCGLRLYESTDEKCWMTTRRLVVSSTPEDDLDIECLSYWLPLDQIQLTLQECEVTMSWSDCGQLMHITDGAFGRKYSFIYNAARPNRKLILEFENRFDARAFEECLLFPTDIPPYAIGLPPQVSLLFKLERPSIHQDIRIYRLLDQDDLENQYHAIVHAFKSPSNFHISYIYYVYLDIDWIIDNHSLGKIELPGLVSPDYESNMRHLPYEPRYQSHGGADPIPAFKEVVETSRTASLSLGCKHNLSKFMWKLTGWQLIYYHISPNISLPSSEKHRNVGIQLWAKPPATEKDTSCMRLAVRFSTSSTLEARRWLTAELSSRYNSKRDELELKDVAVWRGSHVDTSVMMATREGANGGVPERRSCKIGVTFGGPGDKEEFVQLVFGRR